MALRYETEFASDTVEALEVILNQFAFAGGRVIHISWQPERRGDGPGGRSQAGYTVAAEYDDDA
ncbi:hypothetical protein CNY89_26410 [Amaricoccus sp. HAR-UPW-R2A-40]|nr:hypothetical protein CNY89_26410 [Amaricoccus sp. HAR-UPW-R2A-40]